MLLLQVMRKVDIASLSGTTTTTTNTVAAAAATTTTITFENLAAGWKVFQAAANLTLCCLH